MIVVEPSATLLAGTMRGQDALKAIEMAGRLSWKSEGKATEDSAAPFVKMLIRAGHESVLEHVSASARFVVDRGVSHEIVRHRLAAYTQESTRYCNYSKSNEIAFVRPLFWQYGDGFYEKWEYACTICERVYLCLIRDGATPQEARAVLPNSLKTELVMTANLREWRHFFTLRTAPAAHPQMRQVVVPLLAEFKAAFPIVFDDIAV